MERQFIIYKITNQINGFIYVGYTGQLLQERWRQHKHRAYIEKKEHPLYNDMRRYGTENFKIHEIDMTDNFFKAQALEIKRIAEIQQDKKYNISNGGIAGDARAGGEKFWDYMNSHPEEKAKYLKGLSETKKANDWSDYKDMGQKAEEWRKQHPKEAYNQARRASRMLRNGEPQKEKNQIDLKKYLMYKHKRAEIAKTNALSQHAKETQEQRLETAKKISIKCKAFYSTKTSEEKSKITEKARQAHIQKSRERNTKKVYDIINAGSNHRFMANGRIVSNCGKLVQLQNLPQNKFKDLDLARRLVLENDFDLLEMLYPSMMDMFSQLVRTSFIPRPNCTFIVADYSAIEARVIAWLANEKWRLEVFKTHGKIYEASASQMFNVPIESITKDSPLRKKGKVAELALGYQGAVGALEKMGAKDMGLSIEEMEKLVTTWRDANKRIVALWGIVDRAARDAILNPGSTIQILRGIKFKMIEDILFIKLPSGRCLAYQGARIKKNGYRQEICYMGQNQTTQKWEEVPTYGGKLTENITQAVARDCLGAAMLHLNKAGYRPQFHVHDEVIIEVDKASAKEDMTRICELMALHEPWTEGLTLIADAYETQYYMKD